MDTISNNISQIASVRTVTSLNYIKKTYNLPQDDNNSFERRISEETKSTIVSEQQNNSSNPASFNYQFQHSVPVSLLSTANQPYNEATKPFKNDEVSTTKDDTETSDYYVEDSNGKTQKNNLGYYIIDSRIATTSKGKSGQKLSNPFRDRLNKIYSVNYGIEPGTIVNVTCY